MDVQELDSAAGYFPRFQNYEGHEPVVESIEQMEGIGEVLSRNLQADNGRGGYFGKYSVIRAYEPGETTLLNADIIIFSERAIIDDIRNVQRLVDGYLAAAFGYDPKQARELAVLITRYNAAYRGDIKTLSRKYTRLVMSYLSVENAGIAPDYKDWPGKTRLVVPLSAAVGTQGLVPGQPAAPGNIGPTSAGPGGQGETRNASRRPGTPERPTPNPARPPTAAVTGSATPPSGGAPGGPAASASSGSASGAASAASANAAPTSGSVAVGPAATTGTSAPPGSPAPSAAGRQSANRPARPINWSWLLALVAFLLLALLVWLFVQVLRRTAFQPSYERDVRRFVRTGHPLVEMIVIPQNRRIGHRNIHHLKPGSAASVGGGRSTFLIYFVPVPRRTALLKYDGREYTFVPIRFGLFPGVEGPVHDCLGKNIPARSAKGYQFTIVFRKFVPPLEEINRLMRSVLPGSREDASPSR